MDVGTHQSGDPFNVPEEDTPKFPAEIKVQVLTVTYPGGQKDQKDLPFFGLQRGKQGALQQPEDRREMVKAKTRLKRVYVLVELWTDMSVSVLRDRQSSCVNLRLMLGPQTAKSPWPLMRFIPLRDLLNGFL